MTRILKHKIPVAIALILFFALYGYHYYELYQFRKAYSAYEILANKHLEAALIPALAGNPLRQDLNHALSDVLADGKPPAERIARAEEGKALLVLAEGGIDAIGEVGKDVDNAAFIMEKRSKSLFLLTARSDAKHLVSLAGKRSDIIADVRGLSYRANHHTQEIFDRILVDRGELTAEHVRALNELIPSVEEQFDKRSNLYDELQTLSKEIDAARDGMRSHW